MIYTETQAKFINKYRVIYLKNIVYSAISKLEWIRTKFIKTKLIKTM